MHVFHSGFILIWEGRSHVRPGPILLCEHHYYTLNTCGDCLRAVEEGINPALWTVKDKYISELIA